MHVRLLVHIPCWSLQGFTSARRVLLTTSLTTGIFTALAVMYQSHTSGWPSTSTLLCHSVTFHESQLSFLSCSVISKQSSAFPLNSVVQNKKEKYVSCVNHQNYFGDEVHVLV